MKKGMKISGESLVLAGVRKTPLCFDRIVEGSFALRNTYLDGGEPYMESIDFTVDYIAGTVARTKNSRIPDYSEHILYGMEEFDHLDYPDDDLTNHKWFVWADYETENGAPLAVFRDQGQYLAESRKKLEAGGPFKIISYGDSITAGCDLPDSNLSFTSLYAGYLSQNFPAAQIIHTDISIPGQSSREGLAWFHRKPESRNSTPALGMVANPDLILIGFGMNDHNKGTGTPEELRNNLIKLVKLINGRNKAEVILFSTFPPHEKWFHGTHRIEQFVDAIKDAASESRCAYADVYGVWSRVLKRKDQSSLLASNINHPNYFGHWLYERAFEAIKF